MTGNAEVTEFSVRSPGIATEADRTTTADDPFEI